jgi:hypothetical protein
MQHKGHDDKTISHSQMCQTESFFKTISHSQMCQKELFFKTISHSQMCQKELFLAENPFPQKPDSTIIHLEL